MVLTSRLHHHRNAVVTISWETNKMTDPRTMKRYAYYLEFNIVGILILFDNDYDDDCVTLTFLTCNTAPYHPTPSLSVVVSASYTTIDDVIKYLVSTSLTLFVPSSSSTTTTRRTTTGEHLIVWFRAMSCHPSSSEATSCLRNRTTRTNKNTRSKPQ